MWINPDSLRNAFLNATNQGRTTDKDYMERARKRAAKEKSLYALGKAECSDCGEEIWHHPVMNSAGWVWESEHLVGWCDSSKDKKHHPRIVLEEDEENNEC